MHSIPLTSGEVWKWNSPLEVFGGSEWKRIQRMMNVVGRADQRQLGVGGENVKHQKGNKKMHGEGKTGKEDDQGLPSPMPHHGPHYPQKAV